MEAMYAKLYEKYTKLKKKRLSEVDDICKEQEEKFSSYVSAAEEQMQFLLTEKEELLALVDSLRKEIMSIRSAKDKECAEYQKLYLEENQKNNALSEEIERLKMQFRESVPCSSKDGTVKLTTPRSAQNATENLHMRASRKRPRQSEDSAEERTPLPGVVDQVNGIPECCKRTAHLARGDTKDSNTASCVFQALSEQLLGMKLAIVSRTEGICLIALHQSSGYTFSLSWVDEAAGEEPELLYNVLSLGTFERVAPEWMKEVMKFSTSMCPVFFQRVAHVIKLCA